MKNWKRNPKQVKSKKMLYFFSSFLVISLILAVCTACQKNSTPLMSIKRTEQTVSSDPSCRTSSLSTFKPREITCGSSSASSQIVPVQGATQEDLRIQSESNSIQNPNENKPTTNDYTQDASTNFTESPDSLLASSSQDNWLPGSWSQLSSEQKQNYLQKTPFAYFAKYTGQGYFLLLRAQKGPFYAHSVKVHLPLTEETKNHLLKGRFYLLLLQKISVGRGLGEATWAPLNPPLFLAERDALSHLQKGEPEITLPTETLVTR